jgi:hypothetical protein
MKNKENEGKECEDEKGEEKEESVLRRLLGLFNGGQSTELLKKHRPL